MKTKFCNHLNTKLFFLFCLVFVGQNILAQPAVVSNPMAIGKDCNKNAGNNFKVFSYAAGALTSISNCAPSLAAPGFSPSGGSIAFSPADQKVYYIETTTGNNSIVWNWTPGTCPVGSQAPIYTYPATFIVGLEYNPITGDGYQIEFVGASAPYSIFLRKITSYGPPLVAGASQQIFLPPGINIWQQNGDVVMSPTGKMYFGFNNKLFSLDYSPYGVGVLNATYIDTIKGLGTNVNMVGLSYVNGKLIASATDNGSACIYREIDLSTSPVTLTSVTAPAGSVAARTFSSLDMASLITGIGAAKKVFSAAQTGVNTYQVKYDVKVKNYGNVNLTTVQLTDDVKSVFGAAFVSASVAAVGTLPSGLTINGSYNGNTNTNIFAAGGTMKATPKDSATVRVTVNLSNPSLLTFYNNSAKATATGSFFAIAVSDLSDDQIGLSPDPNNNDVPDDAAEDTPTPLRLSDWIVLPVKLIDFNAQLNNKSVDLYWKITNDEDGLQMIVQRSNDGRNFSSIKTVMALNAPGIQKYEWTDPSPSTDGINFYRIQFTEPSGQITYSEIVKVDAARISVKELRVSPVPFNNNLDVSITMDKTEKVACKMMDINGHVVFTTYKIALKGENQFVINNLSGIPAGNYVFQVQTSGQVYNKIVIKNH